MVTTDTSAWAEIVGFFKENTIAGGLFVLFWKAMMLLANHFSEKRKEEFKEIAREEIKEEVDPKLLALTTELGKYRDEVEHLRELIVYGPRKT